MQRSLLCFAHGTAGDWEAICVDLDIAVQGRSFDEVHQLLKVSVDAYVEAAEREDAASERLLGRKAPFWVRAKLAAGFLWNALRHRNDGVDSIGFSMACRV